MFELMPGQLTIQDINQLLESNSPIKLHPNAYLNIEKSYQIVQNKSKESQSIYGLNTGFGALANTKIPQHELKNLQRHIILSHAAGVGPSLDEKTVKLILLLKINSLARGYSGVSTNLMDHLIAFYNSEIYPIIPEQGSVGASGDLAPLAHLSLALIGESDVYLNGKQIPASKALKKAKLNPLNLAEKEGLALLNGTQVSTAIALMGLLKMQRNFAIACIAGALSLDAAAGSLEPFNEVIAMLKNNEGQVLFSGIMRGLLKDSEIIKTPALHQRIQDPYCLRCQPQVMGAIWTYLRESQIHLMNEANAVSDNPLVCIDTNQILSGGNFHAEMIAITADLITIIGAEIGAISERRIALLIDGHLSGLPAFLVKEIGLNSGFMLAQVTAASLASENKTYAHPACVDSLPTSANQEDHVSMATFAATKLHKVAENVLMILAIETLAANQGLDFRAPLHTSLALQPYVMALRSKIPFYEEDHYIGRDIQSARAVLIDPSYYGALCAQLFYQEHPDV